MKRQLAEFVNILFGFRKFLLMLTVVLVMIVFRIYGLVNGAEMVDLLKATTIAFFGANGVEHIMTVVKGGMDAKAAALAPTGLADTDESNDDEDVEVK